MAIACGFASDDFEPAYFDIDTHLPYPDFDLRLSFVGGMSRSGNVNTNQGKLCCILVVLNFLWKKRIYGIRYSVGRETSFKKTTSSKSTSILDIYF